MKAHNALDFDGRNGRCHLFADLFPSGAGELRRCEDLSGQTTLIGTLPMRRAPQEAFGCRQR